MKFKKIDRIWYVALMIALLFVIGCLIYNYYFPQSQSQPEQIENVNVPGGAYYMAGKYLGPIIGGIISVAVAALVKFKKKLFREK